MTSQGNAYSRFRRAWLTKNLTIVEAAAADLGHLRLEDALAVLVVMTEKKAPRFERARARFAVRVILERGSAVGSSAGARGGADPARDT